MEGSVSSFDVAEIASKATGLSIERTHQVFVENCKKLVFFNDVRRYAVDARRNGIKTAIVTLNSDIFLDVIVPHYDFRSDHDLIVCSSEYGTLDKTTLCLVAAEGLGAREKLNQVLLIDNLAANVDAFRQKGGRAYQYTGASDFKTGLENNSDLIATRPRQ
jgi:phosphoglycolate phosphatase-like HAD superfamily hydrolase